MSDESSLADVMNVLLLIEHGLDEAMARRTVNQWNAKCNELAMAKKAIRGALVWFSSDDLVPSVDGEKYTLADVSIGPVTQKVIDDLRSAEPC